MLLFKQILIYSSDVSSPDCSCFVFKSVAESLSRVSVSFPLRQLVVTDCLPLLGNIAPAITHIIVLTKLQCFYFMEEGFCHPYT